MGQLGQNQDMISEIRINIFNDITDRYLEARRNKNTTSIKSIRE